MARSKKKFTTAIKPVLDRIEKLKAKADKVRDELRDAISEVEDIADSFQDGSEVIEDAVRALRRAVDRMSEYV